MKRKKQNKKLLENASEVISHFADNPYLVEDKLKEIHIILEAEDESALQLVLVMKEGKVQRHYETHESPYEMSDRDQSTSGLIN
jgi:hypothetical protein